MRRRRKPKSETPAPINPIKNTYDMSGTRITRFRVELQDQHGEPVDTREEEYNCTIVIEYEIPDMYGRPWAHIWEKYWEEGMERPQVEDIFSFE